MKEICAEGFWVQGAEEDIGIQLIENKRSPDKIA